MRVYIASMFADKHRVKERSEELTALGIECTSRWVEERAKPSATIEDFEPDYFRETAVMDVQDILRADKLILTVPEYELLVNAPVRSSSRGGRHFEAGLFYGLILAQMMARPKRVYPSRELIVMGKPENVFHYLDGINMASVYPAIRVIETWEEVKRYLTASLDGGVNG